MEGLSSLPPLVVGRKTLVAAGHVTACDTNFSTGVERWVVPKSYRSEGQPRSTSSEFPSRAVFGNLSGIPIWRTIAVT